MAACDPAYCCCRMGPLQQMAQSQLVVPMRVDAGLPDYLVKSEEFDRGFLRMWAPGDRFQMLFSSKGGRGGVSLHRCTRQA